MNAPDRTLPSIQLTVNGLALGFRVDKRLLPAVTDIAFTLNGGETLALVGESGCGKSASALALMRLLPVSGCITSGEVRFDGRDLLQLPEAEMRRVRGRDLAMIFQEPATSLNPVMTVCEQIGEALTRCGRGDLSKAGVRRRAGELLSAVGIGDIERRLDAYPFQLSGGLKQRVMIAMALAGEPKILIADEPTTALDVTVQAQILELLRRLQRETGMGMLLITHDLAVVAETADRVGVMYAGELVEIADHAAFFSHHFHPYTQKLFAALPGHSLASTGSGHGHGYIRGESLQTIPGQAPAPGTFPSGCRFAPRCAFAWERCHRESPGWQTLPTPTGAEHRVRCHLAEKQGGMDGKADGKKEGKQPTGIIVDRKECPQNAAQAGQSAAVGRHSQQAVLKVTGLTVHFPIRKGLLQRQSGAVRAVDGVSLELGLGKTLALVGESGCGKTTVGKAILRLVDNSGGTIYLGPGEGQRDIRSMSAREFSAVRHRVQMVFQDPFSSLNPRMRIGDIIEEGMVALGISAGKAGREARLAALAALLAQVGLPADAGERFPHEFSGGQRQRIAIARVLAVQPQIILLDEPTSALDVSVQARILNLLKDLQKELELAYLFITHNFAVVDEMADDVAVMYLGRIVESGSARTLLAAPHHPYTQSLLSAIPRIGHRVEEGVARLAGEAPSPANPPAGCHFHPRCPQAMDICRRQYPAAVTQDEGRQVACHLFKPRD